jgi:hypothetical protein
LKPILFGFSNPEHFGAAGGANALIGRFAIFHGNSFGVLHFFFGFTLNTICFHLIYPPF